MEFLHFRTGVGGEGVTTMWHPIDGMGTSQAESWDGPQLSRKQRLATKSSLEARFRRVGFAPQMRLAQPMSLCSAMRIEKEAARTLRAASHSSGIRCG